MDIFISIWNNFYPAMIGAIVMWVLEKLIDFYKRKKIEMKYCCRGKYITIFEDVVEEKKVESVAPANLDQHGSTISGKTGTNGRYWILDGKISKRGYIYGEYHAERETDMSVGNFFLQQQDNGDLSGVWSGYDSVNKRIYTGRYIFMKQPNFNITYLSEKDISLSIEIVDAVLGKNYIEAEKFRDMLGDERFICLKAVADNKTVGVGIACIMSLHDAVSYLKIERYPLPNIMKPYEQVGIIKTLAINENYQHRGIGSEIFSKFEDILLSKDIHSTACIAWRHDNIENAGNILKRAGYKSQFVIENYWEEESHEQGFSCPVCGDNGCKCSANIYVKAL